MVSVVAFLCAPALGPSEQSRSRSSLDRQMQPQQSRPEPGRVSSSPASRRPRPRALTRRQEHLFFALVFGAGLLLQLALL